MPFSPVDRANTTHADGSMSSVHLDAIRGAAALLVFLGHTRDLYFNSLLVQKDRTVKTYMTQDLSPRPFPRVDQKITFGNESVMIFFVLSGYLVGGGVIKALRRNTWSWKSYLIRRVTRLWVVLIPALLLGVALDFTGLHLFLNPGSIYAAPPQQMVVHNVASQLTVPVIIGNALFLQGILVGSAGSNDSLWSLANEFWYYMAFPVLVLALNKSQTVVLRCGYFVLFLGIAFLVGKTVGMLFFIWMLGALLSIVPLMIPRRTAGVLLVPVALLLPVVFVVVRRATLPIYLAQWIVAVFSACAIYVVLHQTGKARNGIYRSMAGLFSRISYTLYLVHLPLAVLLCASINNPWHRWDLSPRHVAAYLGMNAGIVLFAYCFSLVFEANTDKVRMAVSHRLTEAKYLPKAAASPRVSRV